MDHAVKDLSKNNNLALACYSLKLGAVHSSERERKKENIAPLIPCPNI